MGYERSAIHGAISLIRFVIPGLTRNPVLSWIPAFAGMTRVVVINGVVYIPKDDLGTMSNRLRAISYL